MKVKALFALMLMIVLGVVVHTIVKGWTFSEWFFAIVG